MNVKRNFKLTTALLFVLLLFFASGVIAATLDRQLQSGNDDVEEESNGDMYLDSSDLELGDTQTPITGLKFQNITIPAGSTINSAYITFNTDETDSGDCNLVIAGHSNSDSPDFTSSDNNISGRTKTASTVAWSPSAWNDTDADHNTPNLSTIVQEIIGISGWSSGNGMVFIIDGEGARVAESYESGAADAATLHIDYTEGGYTPSPVISVSPGNLGTDSIYGTNATSDTFELTNDGDAVLDYLIVDDVAWLSCSPSVGSLAAGESDTITVTYSSGVLAAGTHEANITITDTDSAGDGVANNSPYEYDVSIMVYPVPEGASCGDVPVYTENLVSPAIMILLDVSSSMTSLAPYEDADKPHTPDLSAIVAEIVGRAGWSSGNSMVFMIGGSGHRTVESYDGVSGSAPLFHVEYDSGEIDVRVNQSSDDAEQNVGVAGSTHLTSSDLELVYGDGNDQVIGIRFRNIAIPQGATITNAYIEFSIDESNDEATSLVIVGQDADNPDTFAAVGGNISSRPPTSATVSWSNIEEWEAPPEARRIDIGKDVISDLVKDRSISWGYGSWCFTESAGYDGDSVTGSESTTINWTDKDDVEHEDTFTVPTYPEDSGYFTRIHVGTNYNDTTQQAALQAAITATDAHSGTPLGPSMLAAREYFQEHKEDEENNACYYDPGCQPKILINITDGMGYLSHTSADYMEAYTHWLADAGITAVGVGFGLSNASQLQRLARVSNARGAADDGDNIYALHDEVDGVGQPFLASSKAALVEALNDITSSLKAQVFHGSAPAPTTSVDYGNIVITAKFDATDWSGDLVAQRYDGETGALTTDMWSAVDEMPIISAYTANIDGSGDVISYPSSPTNPDDLYKYYDLKPLGDIINSTPIIVEEPAFYYSFNDYNSFRHDYRDRNELVYIGANDGALHVFDLGTGVEQWRFYPASMHADLAYSLVETSEDLAYPLRSPPGDYCHKYFVDGSPVAADVYDGSDWKTVLVTGLGEGGASYFALDVTDGNSFTGSDTPTLLWELTDTDTDTELGLALSEPEIARVAGPKWGVFIGSGYSEMVPTDQTNKEAYLFGFDVLNKSSFWEDSSGNPINKIKVSATSLLDDALSSPLVVDLDGDDSAGNENMGEFIYAGNLYGSMYRFANIGDGEAPTVSKLFDLGRSSHENPIRAKASFAYDEEFGNIWVYFGTGKYEKTADKTTLNQQFFVGLKDNDSLRGAAETSGNSTYYWNASTDAQGTPSEDMNVLEADRITVGSGDAAESYRVIKNCADSSGSWLLKLDNSTPGMMGSERVISQPLVVGGVVFFTTFIPDVNVCSGNGEAWLYALDYKTGCPPTNHVFDINGDGTFSSGDSVQDADGNSYPVAGIYIGAGQPSKPVFEKDIVFVTTTGDGLKAKKVNLPNSKIVLKSWRELRN